MVHVQLFIYFIALFVAATTSFLLWNNKKSSKYPFSSQFFYYYLSLMFLVVGLTVANYRLFNITLDRTLFSHFIDVWLKLSANLLIFTLPVFLVSMVGVKKSPPFYFRLKILSLSVFLLNMSPYVLIVSSDIGQYLLSLSHHVQSIILMFVITYSILFVSRHFRSMKRRESRFILGGKFVLAILFIPLFGVDMYRNELIVLMPYLPKDLWYTPIYFLLWSGSILLIDSKSSSSTVGLLGVDNLSGVVEPFKLTKREVEVLSLILSGKTGKVIACELYISESTIKKHTKSIYTKLSVDNKVSLLHKINQLSS